MNRLCALVGSAMVAGLVGSSSTALAQTSAPRPASDGQQGRVALSMSGNIEGVVRDERGAPLAGAMVSALGSASAVAVTDRGGAFVLRALPAGPYMVRVHLSGFAPSRRQLIEVRGASQSRFAATLQRTFPSPGSKAPPPPTLLAAGMAPLGAVLDPLLLAPPPSADDPAKSSEDRTEKAWRIRHLPRSVLKDTTDRVAKYPASHGSADKVQSGTAAAIARAMGSSVRLLADLPLTGQVNLLTSSSFDGSSSPAPSD